MHTILRLLLSIALLLAKPLALAAPPQAINYQGYLTSPAGAPVNTAVSMTFRLYNASSGGSPLWIETQASVAVTNGSFSVVLGSVTPIPLPFDVPYWFTVAVNADAEMSPRQPLAASPYAFRATTADTISTTATIPGSQLTGTITTATIPAANVVGGSGGTVTSIATGQGLTGGPIFSSGTISLANTQLLPTNPCNFGFVTKWNGSVWQCAPDENVPPGANAGQVLATPAFGAPIPAWTSSPTLNGMLTLQNSLELAGPSYISRFGSRFLHNSGSANTFVGTNAGTLFTSGTGNNTAIGDSALGNVGGGASNTAVGSGALLSVANNNNNTAVGVNALRNTGSGSNNVAVGQSAGNTTNAGSNNTFIGNNAGVGLGSGSNGNIIIGSNAGSVVNTGSANNIYIGNVGNAVDGSAIRIGTPGTQLTTAIAGISGFSSPGGTAVFINASGVMGTSNSSRRYKDEITDMNEASSALMNLRPVTFYYKADKNPAGRELQYGLIAEEVNDIYPGLVAHGVDGQIETVMYQHLPPMLLNEFQKQQRALQAQSARVEALERELKEIKSLLGRK